VRNRGRRSVADLAVIPIRPRDHRLQPPADLDANAAAIFRELAASVPAAHFIESDRHLLATYAMALSISRRSAGDPASLQQWERATRIVAQLSSKLRLCPSSRLDPKTAGRRSANYAPSYYERMAAGDE